MRLNMNRDKTVHLPSYCHHIATFHHLLWDVRRKREKEKIINSPSLEVGITHLFILDKLEIIC